jgi:hypothetical protein
MRALRYLPVSASLLLGLVGAGPAIAQTPNVPWVQMQSTSINLGIGGQSGEGMLYLPNLGTNCSYPFTVQGFGVGPHVGVSLVAASGLVKNLTKVPELAGHYSALQGEATVIAGAGVISMKNNSSNVVIDLNSHTRGLALGGSGQGMDINLNAPIPNAPRTYVLEFGFDKTWVNKESRAELNQLLAAWKCHFVNFQLVGHTDTIGKEDANLDLGDKRAQAVREYLIGAGVVPSRIALRSAGENEPLVPTPNHMRLRANRAVVIAVSD